MTKLVVNAPDYADGAEVEVPPYGKFKVGETVELDQPVLDKDGKEIATIKAYDPPKAPVKKEDTGAADTKKDGAK